MGFTAAGTHNICFLMQTRKTESRICRFNYSVTVSPHGMQCPGLVPVKLTEIGISGVGGGGGGGGVARQWPYTLSCLSNSVCMFGSTFCMLGNFSCFCCRLLTFFKIDFFEKFLQELPSECQTVWIQIRTDILSVLIWVQTVCRGYQQMTKSPLARNEILERPFYMQGTKIFQ